MKAPLVRRPLALVGDVALAIQIPKPLPVLGIGEMLECVIAHLLGGAVDLRRVPVELPEDAGVAQGGGAEVPLRLVDGRDGVETSGASQSKLSPSRSSSLRPSPRMKMYVSSPNPRRICGIWAMWPSGSGM